LFGNIASLLHSLFFYTLYSPGSFPLEISIAQSTVGSHTVVVRFTDQDEQTITATVSYEIQGKMFVLWPFLLCFVNCAMVKVWKWSLPLLLQS